MKDGITVTGNGDAMYMGLRAMPDVPDEEKQSSLGLVKMELPEVEKWTILEFK